MKYALLLNQTYEPINVITARRAVVKAMNERVYVESYYPQTGIKTAGGELIRIPSVVRLKQYINFNSFVDKEVVSRHDIYYRDNHKCGYCGKELFRNGAATLDHIVPKSRGGKHTKSNLVTACKKCNSKKSNFTLEECGMRLRFPLSHLKTNIHLLKVKEMGNKIPEWKAYF